MISRIVLWINAGVLLALGVAMLVPLALSLLYRDGSWPSLLIPAVAMIAAGGLGFWFLRPDTRGGEAYVSPRNILLSVTLAWVLASLIGGTPYLLEGTFTNPIDSAFEAMSGFTTTGATLLSDIEAESPSILFWRSMTQWLGGIGIVVLFVAVAPYLGSSPNRGALLCALRILHIAYRFGPHYRYYGVYYGVVGKDNRAGVDRSSALGLAKEDGYVGKQVGRKGEFCRWDER